MKKLIAALAFFVGFTANANLITLEVSDNLVGAGDTVQVTVLGSFTEEFDTLFFDVEFDTDIFTFEGSSLYSDLTAFVDPTSDTFSVTSELFGVSVGLLLDFLSFPIAAGDYVLAQFELTASDDGNTTLNLANELVASANAPTGFSVDVEGRSQSVAVSAPATLGLFGMACLALFGFRRKA